MDYSEGSTEETNYLTASVAHKFSEKVLISANAALMRKEMNERR